ncbi:uncharacterized protein LOC144463884 [Epinephelus lanceolatus]
MKCVFALVALLHLCYSYKLNKTLNGEIKAKLDILHHLCSKKEVNITSPDMVRIPGPEMTSHASSCVSVYVRELKHLLGNVTVHKGNEHILQELEANLQALDPHQEANPICRMVQRRSLLPFKTYTLFLKKLNLSQRR